MKIEYKKGEDNFQWTEIFEHDCFDKKIMLSYVVEEQEWVDDVRIIKKARLISVEIEK